MRMEAWVEVGKGNWLRRRLRICIDFGSRLMEDGGILFLNYPPTRLVGNLYSLKSRITNPLRDEN